MEYKDLLIVLSTFLGPVFAVQAQKFIETVRERKNRKRWIFHTLMATRTARIGSDHVQALNMIDLVFYGENTFGVHRRSKKEQAIIAAWNEYRDHLGTTYSESAQTTWLVKSNDLFVNLLYAMALDVGFSFDKVQLKNSAYSPIAHGDIEQENIATRKAWLEVIEGKRPLKMEILKIPTTPTPVSTKPKLGDY